MSAGIENDVYRRYGVSLADFPKLDVPSGHSDEAELFCAKAAWAAYSVYPTLPHDADKDRIPSRFADSFAAQSVVIEQAIDPEGGEAREDFESRRGYRTLAVDRAGALMIWDEDRLVLAFRGTANWQDWIHNFAGDAIAPPDRHGEKRYTLHKGFTGLAANLYPAVVQLLESYVESRSRVNGKPLDLIVCGHSLGGALALNFARQYHSDTWHDYRGMWHRSGVKNLRLVSSFTFGTPRIGKGVIWEAISRPHYRLVVRGDPVPKTPPMFDEDFEATYLEKYDKPAVQPEGAIGKIKRAFSARNLSPVDFSAHYIEAYIDAIAAKILAASGGK